MRRLAVSTVALTAAFMLLATASGAATLPRLSFFKGGGASIGWSTAGGSSPTCLQAGCPTDNQSIAIVTPTPGADGTAAGAYTYGSNEAEVGIVGGMLNQVKRLAFDSKGYLGAGAPRLSLLTSVGTFFLSASYCNVPLTGGWRSSVFADRLNTDNTENQTCTIFGPSTPLTPSGAYPNWTAVLAEHGTATVNDWFLIVDEGPATVYVDRLTIQSWGWVRSGTPGIINCDANLGCAA